MDMAHALASQSPQLPITMHQMMSKTMSAVAEEDVKGLREGEGEGDVRLGKMMNSLMSLTETKAC
jgi:hypothetical protein